MKKNLFLLLVLPVTVVTQPNKHEQLINAARTGDITTLRKHVGSVTNIDNICDKNGESLLHLAAKYGHKEIIKELLLRGADIWVQNYQSGLNIPRYQHTNGDFNIDREGKEIEITACSPLDIATYYGQEEVVKLLLTEITTVTKFTNPDTAFNIAISLDKAKMAQHFIESGKMNPNNNVWGNHNRPLHLAVKHGNTEMINMLIQAGANINGHSKIVTSKLTAPDFIAPLHIAAWRDNNDIVMLLLKHGARINVLDGRRYAPLHWAVANNHPEIVRILLTRGAYPNIGPQANIPDNLGCFMDTESPILIHSSHLPIHLASERGLTEIVRLLIAYNSLVSMPSIYDGHTPLHLAAHTGAKNLVNLLLENGADSHAKNRFGLFADAPSTAAYPYGCTNDEIKSLISQRRELKEKLSQKISFSESTITNSRGSITPIPTPRITPETPQIIRTITSGPQQRHRKKTCCVLV